MRKYKIGMIGCGGFGNFCASGYRQMEEVEIAAVSGKDPKEMADFAKKFDIPFTTLDHHQLFSDPNIDIITIMTPPHRHHEMAVGAAKAGKAFLVEKPIALSLQEADDIIQTAKEHKVASTIGYVMRYTQIYNKVIEIAKTNQLGKLTRMLFENYATGHLPDSHWLFDKSKSGGLLVEHGVHFFDIFTAIAGKKFLKAKSYCPNPRQALAVVEYPDNLVASFYHAFNMPGQLERNSAKFVFEKGYIEIDGWIPLTIRVETENDKQEFVTNEDQIELTKEEYYRELIKDVMRDLVKKIENPDHKTMVTLDDARDSLELALEATNNPIF